MKTCVKFSMSRTLIEIDMNIDLTWSRISAKYFSFINDISHFEFATSFTDENSKDIVIQTIAYLYEQKTYSLSIILLKMNSMIDNSFELTRFFLNSLRLEHFCHTFEYAREIYYLSRIFSWRWRIFYKLLKN